ncbi:hypothetical protein GCM10027575_64280 [Phytohabitans suffuscus]
MAWLREGLCYVAAWPREGLPLGAWLRRGLAPSWPGYVGGSATWGLATWGPGYFVDRHEGDMTEGASMRLDDDDITGTGGRGEGPADGGANPMGRDGGADGTAGGEGPADGGANPTGRDGGADGGAGEGPADGGANPMGRDGGADGGAGEGPADGGANPMGRDGGADGGAKR